MNERVFVTPDEVEAQLSQGTIRGKVYYWIYTDAETATKILQRRFESRGRVIYEDGERKIYKLKEVLMETTPTTTKFYSADVSERLLSEGKIVPAREVNLTTASFQTWEESERGY